MDAVKIVNKISKEHGTIKNVYFLACGGSLVDLYPGYYFLRAESAVMDAQWIPAREFAPDSAEETWKRQSADHLFTQWKDQRMPGSCQNRTGCRGSSCNPDTCTGICL